MLALLTAGAAMALSVGCVAQNGPVTAPTPGLAGQPVGASAAAADVGLEEGSASDTTAAATEPAATPGSARAVATPVVGQPGGIAPGAPQQPATQPRQVAAIAAPRPGSAVYRCNGGRSITVENRRSSVTLLDPDGETMVLPASPAGQLSRYGQKPYALVLDGNEALYVKPRKSPYTCKR